MWCSRGCLGPHAISDAWLCHVSIAGGSRRRGCAAAGVSVFLDGPLRLDPGGRRALPRPRGVREVPLLPHAVRLAQQPRELLADVLRPLQAEAVQVVVRREELHAPDGWAAHRPGEHEMAGQVRPARLVDGGEAAAHLQRDPRLRDVDGHRAVRARRGQERVERRAHGGRAGGEVLVEGDDAAGVGRVRRDERLPAARAAPQPAHRRRPSGGCLGHGQRGDGTGKLAARPGQRDSGTVAAMKIAIALAAAVLLGAAAPAAHPTTVSYGADGALVVTGARGETNRLRLQSDPGGGGRLVVYEGSSSASLSGPPAQCTPGYYSLTCDWNPAAGVRVDLGDGDDWGYVSFDLPKTARFTLAGGPGDDRLQASSDGQATTLDGGPGKDELDGGPGPDVLLGGDDADTLSGGGGPDRLDGGAGDDLLAGGDGADAIDGGAGTDRMEADWEDDADSPVTVTLAGGADDGRPGEADDVRSVERVITHSASRLVGTDAPEYLETLQVAAPSRLAGGGGNDTLRAGDGADTLDGGPGDDDIDGGFGDDTITGGPARDPIPGARRGGDCGPLWCKYPYGNDTIDARDGERDSIVCGFGEDTVYADALDVVDGDCEHVSRGAAPPAPADGPGTPTPAGGGAAPPAPAGGHGTPAPAGAPTPPGRNTRPPPGPAP